MRKVKTESVRRHKRTFLLYVCTENCFQRFLKKMCRTVVFLCISSCRSVDLQRSSLAFGKHTGFHMSHVTEFAAAKLNGIFYHESSVFCLNHTGIAFLTAHCCVERCFLYKYCSFLSFHKRSYNFLLCCENCDFRIKRKVFVSHKFCCDRSVDLIVNGSVRTHVVCDFTGFTCFHTLLFHCCLEAFFIDSVAFFLQDFFCKVKRESVSII